MDLINRPRRLRSNPFVRSMVRETKMNIKSLVYPIFIKEGTGIKEEISSMENQFRYSIDMLPQVLKEIVDSGVQNVMLFGIPDKKDPLGTGAWNEDGIIQRALRVAKKECPELYYITDVCLCEYTSHGHCGMLKGQEVDNDSTLPLLAKTALSHVKAGADMVAPSDMMDGRVAAIRSILDENGYENIPIMSYAVKYSSSFYGPFREAAGSAPSFGDRKTYQMDYHNRKEAMREALLDISEGADIIMVKPAMSYLDIIRRAKEKVNVPICAYNVSGEFAMVKAAAEAGLINEKSVALEMLLSMKRAGADMIITYFALDAVRWLKEN